VPLHINERRLIDDAHREWRHREHLSELVVGNLPHEEVGIREASPHAISERDLGNLRAAGMRLSLEVWSAPARLATFGHQVVEGAGELVHLRHAWAALAHG